MGRDTATHIGFYGLMNVGKSTLVNRLTGQQTVIVSAEAGTTTDPVRRSYELTDYGPVVLVDTAGVDDTQSELGQLRVERSLQTLTEVDVAVVLLYGMEPCTEEQRLLDTVQANEIPTVILPCRAAGLSAEEVWQRIRQAIPHPSQTLPPFFGDRTIAAGDVLLLVCPIDSAAPAGRLILPQVQALRAALDLHAVAVTVQPDELPQALTQWRPRLIITDSQVFREVTEVVKKRCPEVEVTSFSVLLADLKGDKTLYTEGLQAVDRLRAGDRVLIIENCSHQVTCDDIGRSKIPGWLREYTGIESLEFVFVSGRDPLPAELHTTPGYFALAVQCGGCVATRRMVQARIRAAHRNGVPITNYGMLIRKMRVRP